MKVDVWFAFSSVKVDVWCAFSYVCGASAWRRKRVVYSIARQARPGHIGERPSELGVVLLLVESGLSDCPALRGREWSQLESLLKGFFNDEEKAGRCRRSSV